MNPQQQLQRQQEAMMQQIAARMPNGGRYAGGIGDVMTMGAGMAPGAQQLAQQQQQALQQIQNMPHAQAVNTNAWPGLLAGPGPVAGYLGRQIASPFEQAIQAAHQFLYGANNPMLQGLRGAGIGGAMGRSMIDGTQFQQNPYLQHLQQLGQRIAPTAGAAIGTVVNGQQGAQNGKMLGNVFNGVTSWAAGIPKYGILGYGRPEAGSEQGLPPGQPANGYIPPQAQQTQGATVPNPYLQYLEGNGNVFGARTPLQ